MMCEVFSPPFNSIQDLLTELADFQLVIYTVNSALHLLGYEALVQYVILNSHFFYVSLLFLTTNFKLIL